MKEKYINFTICLLTIIIFIELFSHSKLLFSIFIDTSTTWLNLIPFIFPLFIITDILSNYGFINFLSNIFGKFMKIFNLPPQSSYAFFMSFLSGFPGNSKLICELLDLGEINTNDGEKLLYMTHFSNPMFIIGTIGLIYLKNQNISLIILIIHYLTNFIIGFIFCNKKENNKVKPHIIHKKIPFIKLITKSINNTINTLILILGIMLFFSLLVNIITINFHLSPLYHSLITSTLEITQGLKLISNLDISLKIKASLITFFLSFGGLSIHMQVMGILSNYKVNYLKYLFARILHGLISSIIIYFII